MRFIVLQANILNPQNPTTTTKLVDAVTYADEGGDPKAFFVAGITSGHKKLGEVDINVVEGGPALDHMLPEMFVEAHE